ncbi:MaoC family dehydratase (plasmid) [Brucella pituitosa]|uniref:MaoC family dehydratase n=1 Tax=Brucella pituitosa TaxID=571256 RepID=UPI000AEBAA9D
MRLSEKNYFEDIENDYSYETPAITLGEHHILTFAGLTGDFTPVHVDEEFAREMGFRGRLAHGLLGLSMIDALKNRCLVQFHVVAALNWNWRFTGPLFIGDQLKAHLRITDKRLTSKGNRGIITLDIRATNQQNETVQEGTNQIMVLCRPSK